MRWERPRLELQMQLDACRDVLGAQAESSEWINLSAQELKDAAQSQCGSSGGRWLVRRRSGFVPD